MEALILGHCKALKIDLDVLAQRRPRGEEAATQSATERLLENDKDGVNEIPFYRASEKPYGAFSNLARRPITFEGRVFPTAEHAYQAGKVRKEEVREWLITYPAAGFATSRFGPALAITAAGAICITITLVAARMKAREEVR